MRRVYFLSAIFMILNIGCQSERLDIETDRQGNALISPVILKSNNEEIKVATYNLHLFLGAALFEDKIRQTKITEFIRQSLSDNDVLYLSEVWKDITKNEIIENLKDIYPFSIYSNAVNLTQGDGLLILSKFPIQENSFTVFSDGAGFDWFAPKGFHKTRFSTPNGIFYSFFTHTQADSDKSSTRKKQLEQMNSQMKGLDKVPVIIVGDLNIVGDFSEEYKYLKSLFSSYKDSFREMNENEGFTYDNSTNKLANYFYSVSSNGVARERLDYILVSNTRIQSSDLITKCTYTSEALKEDVPCSDHYGVQTTLILENNTQESNPYILNTYEEAKSKINSLKSIYGTGLTAKIIIHNNTNEDIIFNNKSQWYNSSFFNSPPSKIPSGKYGVVLATHDTGEATGVFNQLGYMIGSTKLSFGTYVPWSWVYTNNVLVDFNEITKSQLENNSTSPTIAKTQDNIKITGKIATGDSPLVEFSVEKT